MTRGLRSVLACGVLLGGGAALAQQDTMDRVGPQPERQAPGGPTPRTGQGRGAEEGTGGSGPAGQAAEGEPQGAQEQGAQEQGQGLPRLRPSARSQESRQLGNDLGGTGDGMLGW